MYTKIVHVVVTRRIRTEEDMRNDRVFGGMLTPINLLCHYQIMGNN